MTDYIPEVDYACYDDEEYDTLNSNEYASFMEGSDLAYWIGYDE